jgi:4-hydroxybenzoate polyprenyltransferase
MSTDSAARTLGSSETWTLIFMLVSYLMGFASIFGAVQKGLAAPAPKRPFWGVTEQLTVLGLLILAFWGLESLAHLRAPYYVYSSSFSDLVPRTPWPDKWAASHVVQSCARHVRASQVGIPLSVVVLEGSLTYSALWTARLLELTLWVQPIFAGFTMFLIDLLLDPIVAMGCDCELNPLPSAGNGLGLWHWIAPRTQDLGPGDHLLALFFQIPIFNYAAWIGAPIVALAVINIGPFTRDWAMPQFKNVRSALLKQPATESPRRGGDHLKLFSVLVLLAALFLVIAVGPGQNPSVRAQEAWVFGTVLFAFLCLAGELGRFRSVTRVDATLTTPVALALAVPASAGLIGGQFVSSPWLMAVAVMVLFGGLWLGWLPYGDALKKFRKRLASLDAFVRLHYLGFTTMMVLLGASFFDQSPRVLTMLGLLMLAAAFHVFSYVSNDLIDLEHDRRAPLRKNHPLLTGEISVPTAVALVVLCVPWAALALLHLQGFRSAGLWGFVVLGGAFACMLVYNWAGKLCPWPWVTDLVQGAAWGALSLVGASALTKASAPISFSLAWQRCDVLFWYGLAFIFLINGIHGGLRDLAHDRAGGKHTLAIHLGAAHDPQSGQVVSSWGIVAFAMLVHGALVGLVAWFLYRETHLSAGGTAYATSNSLAAVIVLSGLAFSTSFYQLWRVVRIREPRRNAWISWNLPFLLAPPIVVFWGAATVDMAFKIMVTLFFAVPLLLQDEFLPAFLEWAYDQGDGQSVIRRFLNQRRTLWAGSGILRWVLGVAARGGRCAGAGDRALPLKASRDL